MKRRGNNQSQNQKFWNKEYKGGEHLALSDNPSEDLVKFTNWMERECGRKFLNPISSVLDLGCGNGRNLVYLGESFGMRGMGIDISSEAISLARKASESLPLQYQVQSIADPIPLQDNTQTFVLDMMTSHFLNNEEREKLLLEIVRVLKPEGWLFLKTFLKDEDEHAIRLLKENPGEEKGSYIHPKIGVSEHVFTEAQIVTSLSQYFFIHKITKSHNPKKRRSMSVYAQKVI